MVTTDATAPTAKAVVRKGFHQSALIRVRAVEFFADASGCPSGQGQGC